jgi:hypothetical protein
MPRFMATAYRDPKSGKADNSRAPIFTGLGCVIMIPPTHPTIIVKNIIVTHVVKKYYFILHLQE